MSAVIRSVKSSTQPAEANWSVQIVSICTTSKPPPPLTAVLILSSRALYSTIVWLTLMPLALVKSSSSGVRALVVSDQSKLTSPPLAAAAGAAVASAAGAAVASAAGAAVASAAGALVAAAAAGAAVGASAAGALVAAGVVVAPPPHAAK